MDVIVELFVFEVVVAEAGVVAAGSHLAAADIVFWAWRPSKLFQGSLLCVIKRECVKFADKGLCVESPPLTFARPDVSAPEAIDHSPLVSTNSFLTDRL